MSMLFSILSFYAAHSMRAVVYEVNSIRDELRLNVSPDVGFLTFVLVVCGGMFLITEIGLIMLFALML
jgi:hypothetical protein